MTSYTHRNVDDELDHVFGDLPAVLLDGPKGVGKTTTALRRAATIRRLDDPGQRAILQADLSIIAADPAPVLLDEWQHLPEVFDAVKRSVDDDPSGGRFILTGSAHTPTSTHSGAGRITPIRMRPLTLHERLGTGSVSLAAILAGEASVAGRSPIALTDYVGAIIESGLPAIRRLGVAARRRALDGYLEQIATKDFPLLGRSVRNPERVLALLRAYAAAVSTSTSLEKIRRAAVPGGPPLAKTTTLDYFDLLEHLRILDPLPAWRPSRNHLLRLSQGPVHHLADPALSARLVRLDATSLTSGRTPDFRVPHDGAYLGQLFESLAVLSVRPLVQTLGGRCYHLRDENGRREVDLIVETDDGITAIEVKLSATISESDVSHLNWLHGRLGTSLVNRVVLHTGPEAYRRSDGVLVVPLALLAP